MIKCSIIVTEVACIIILGGHITAFSVLARRTESCFVRRRGLCNKCRHHGGGSYYTDIYMKGRRQH